MIWSRKKCSAVPATNHAAKSPHLSFCFVACLAALAASAAFAPAAYALPEDFVFEDHSSGWRTDLRQSVGTMDAQMCQIVTGSVNPQDAGSGASALPTDEDGNPIFYGNGNIRHVFGQQAFQWINTCEIKGDLHYRIGAKLVSEYWNHSYSWHDRSTHIKHPVSVGLPRMPLPIVLESPGLFLHVAKLGSEPVIINNGEGYRTVADGAVVLTRAPAEFREELFPLDDRLLVRLDKFEGRNGTLVVALPPWVAKDGKDYAVINGQKVDLVPPPDPLAGEGGLFSEPPFAGGDPLVFIVPYEVDLSGGASLANAVLEIEVFPDILDKHLYQVWDGSCYRYRHDGATPDPSMTVIYKAATGKPACVSLNTAQVLQDSGWGVVLPDDISPVHVLTTTTRFNGVYMEPYRPEAPIVTHPVGPEILEWYEDSRYTFDFLYNELDRCEIDPKTDDCVPYKERFLRSGLGPLMAACGIKYVFNMSEDSIEFGEDYVRNECTALQLAEFVGENCGMPEACSMNSNMCYAKEECSTFKNNMFYYEENQHLLP